MTQDQNPQDALASIRAAREGLAPPGNYPFTYDIAYGLICGLLVAAQGMASPWSTLVLVVSMGGLAVLVMWWRKTFGWWVSGYTPKRARWVALGLVAVMIGLMGVSLYGRYVGPSWLFMVSGGLGFVAAIVGGRLWMRVWRKELAEGVQ